MPRYGAAGTLGEAALAVFTRVSRSIRWRLGRRVADSELERGTDADVTSFYNRRITDCAFLREATHYEAPRASWVLQRVTGGQVLEVGAGNGGMTRLLRGQVTALDVSGPSLEALRALRLRHVVATVESLVEHFTPERAYDYIVLAEVLEHLRQPAAVLARCWPWLTPQGAIVLTTPNGRWPSNEHLQEFTLRDVTALALGLRPAALTVSHILDRQGTPRWIGAQITRGVE